MERMEGNFMYIYEKMSGIEYDNANFKDKLTSLLGGVRPNKPAQEHIGLPQQKHKNGTMLDILGQCSPSQTFFQNV
jgi:hypothetical protein